MSEVNSPVIRKSMDCACCAWGGFIFLTYEGVAEKRGASEKRLL